MNKFGLTSSQIKQYHKNGYLAPVDIFHLQENSAQLIRNATTEVGVYSGILAASLNLMTETLVLIGILAVLLYVQPMSTLVVASSLFLSFGHISLSPHKLSPS